MISTRDALTSSSSDSAVRWLRSRLGDPTAEDLAAAADSLEAETVGHLEATGSASLSSLFDRWPEVLGEPALLDTVLDVAVEWFVRERGVDRDDALRRLRDANPGLSAQLELCRVLSDAIGVSCSTAAQPKDDVLTLPAEIGPPLTSGGRRYELRQLLGRGSQGRVYLAVDRVLSDQDRPAWVAVKLARVSSAAAAQRLIDEAAKARRVEHHNVVRVLDADVTGANHTHLVTEYIEGGTLERLRCGASDRQAVNTAVEALASVCRGVQAIHSQGLVHCDLKPTNVLLTGHGVPKVADFGLSVRRWSASAVSEPALAGGNLAFMSPEQFRHPDRPPAPPGDVYALGGLLLWVLTGRGPNGATGSEVAARLTRGDSKAIEADLAGIVDDDLRAIARRALADKTADRYASADALAADLERWLEHEPLPWRSVSLWRRGRLFARREPMLTAVAGVAVLVVLGTGIVGGLLVARAERRRVEATAQTATAQVATDRAIADKRIAEAEARANEARATGQTQSVNAARIMLKAMVGDVSEQWLPMMTALETLIGPTILVAPGGEAANVWSERVAVGGRLIEKLEARSGGMTVESAAWRACVAYWKVRLNDPAGGRELALSTARLWTERGWPTTDPLFKKLSLIEALAEFTGDTAGAPPERAEALRTKIRTIAGELRGEYQEDPLSKFALHRIEPDTAGSKKSPATGR